MIDRIVTKKNIKSRFYLHNLGLAENLETYCQKHNGEISGTVNGAILEFKLILRRNNLKIQIDGIRQHSNVNAGNSTGYSMIKNTIIVFSKVNFGRENWKIYQTNKLRDFFNNIIGKCSTFIGAPGYSIASWKEIKTINNYRNFRNLFEIAEVRSVSYSNEVMRIEYFTLLGTQSIDELIAMIDTE